MKRKRRSIGDRMKAARDPEMRLDIAHTWADEWHAEHIEMVGILKKAIDRDNMDEIRMAIAALRTLTEQKHIALHRIFNVLARDGDKY